MSVLYIYTAGGIGNRFGGLVAGLIVSKLLNKTPKIIWNPCNHCGAKMEDLFEGEILNYEFDGFNAAAFFEQNKEIVNIMPHDLLLKGLTYINPYNFYSYEHLLQSLNIEKDIFVNLCWIPDYLINFLPEVLNIVRFKQEYLDKAHQIINQNTDGKFYGIHRRKTDFDQGDVKDSKFLDMVKNNPDKKFFICSDDEETEKLFLSYPNVFSHIKNNYTKKKNLNLGWNEKLDDAGNLIKDYSIYNVHIDKETSKSAIVDLLILSKSEIIITNQRSSFLQTAINLSKK
jgi:hypothetical protein